VKEYKWKRPKKISVRLFRNWAVSRIDYLEGLKNCRPSEVDCLEGQIRAISGILNGIDYGNFGDD